MPVSSERVAAHIAAIYEEHGLTYDAAFEDDLLDIDGAYAAGCFWVEEDEAGIVATCGVVPNGSARLIKRMYVASRARRRGLARQLLRRACAWGDFRRSELWSDVRFRGAHAMYRAEGFVSGPVRVLDDPDRSVELYFSRMELP